MEPSLGVVILVGVDYFDHMKGISENFGRASKFRYITDSTDPGDDPSISPRAALA